MLLDMRGFGAVPPPWHKVCSKQASQSTVTDRARSRGSLVGVWTEHGLIASGNEIMNTQQASDKLELRSVYLNPPVMHAHGVTLSLPPEDEHSTRQGILRLDPNWCSLDEWGDLKGCTRMALRDLKVDVTRIRLHDPTGHKRIPYVVESPDFEHEELKLIEFPDAHCWYLIHQRKGAGTSVVPLFPAEYMLPIPGGLISTRYGVAMREVMKRGHVEEMRAEAELVRKVLAELDSGHGGSVRVAPTQVHEVRAALAELDTALGKLGG